MQSLKVTAFAFPVADRVVDELQLRNITEIGNGKYRLKNRLESGIVAFTRQTIHLQETVVRTLLNLDEVGNLDGRRNFGKIETCTEGAFRIWHQKLLNLTCRGERLQSALRGVTFGSTHCPLVPDRASDGRNARNSVPKAENLRQNGWSSAQQHEKTFAPRGTNVPVGAIVGT
jgi:hypothetical protein